MKLFKRSIELKIKRLDQDQRCLYLANRLIEEVQKAGHDINFSENLASVDITIWKPSKLIKIDKIGKWEIKGELTAKIK